MKPITRSDIINDPEFKADCERARQLAYARVYPTERGKGRGSNQGTLYLFNNESLTLSQWARKTGIAIEVLSLRLTAGWPVERAFTEPLGCSKQQGFSGVRYFHDGKDFTLHQWENETGIPVATLRHRLRSGIPFSQAITMPRTGTKRRHAEKHTVNGETRTTIEWAQHLGLTYNAFMQRVHRGGVEDAVLLGPKKRRGGVSADFRGLTGTGGGRHAQDISELEISQ